MFRTSPVHHQERFVQAVFADLVCGTTVRTARHVQPLRSNLVGLHIYKYITIKTLTENKLMNYHTLSYYKINEPNRCL